MYKRGGYNFKRKDVKKDKNYQRAAEQLAEEERMKEPKIKAEYKEFALAYVETLNAAESYRRAYGNGKNSRSEAVSGNRIKNLPEVQEYIEYLLDKHSDMLEISEALIVREMKKIIESEEITPTKLRALELEGKRLGRYKDKVEVEKRDIIVSLED